MITAGDFRNGVTFEMDGNVVSIIEFQHVKPGKGAAFVRTKIRNVITGAVTERTFNPNDKYPTAYIERKDMQYLYSDGDLYYFMDNETYEQPARHRLNLRNQKSRTCIHKTPPPRLIVLYRTYSVKILDRTNFDSPVEEGRDHTENKNPRTFLA